MGSFWTKYILFELKKYRGVIFRETEEGYKIWKGTDFSFKIDIRNLTGFDLSTQKSQTIFTLRGSFWAKYILFELKKYRRAIFHETEEGYKILRGIDFPFGKWHHEFGKISPEHSKVSKLELWSDPSVQSGKCMSLKFTEELCAMNMKRNKIEEEPTCHFKIGMRNLTNFDPSTWKSKKFVLIHFLSPKYITFGLQKYIGIIFHKELCNLWRKNGLWFEKWHEKFSRFSPEHFKVSKLGLRCDPFVEGRKGLTLKFTEDLCAMTMKNNSKCEEELTCHFKTDMRNLTKFDSNARKCKKNVKVYVWAKKSTEELCLMALKIDAKFAGKVTCVQKWHEKFGKYAWAEINE